MANIVKFWKNAIIYSRNVVPKFDNLFWLHFTKILNKIYMFTWVSKGYKLDIL